MRELFLKRRIDIIGKVFEPILKIFEKIIKFYEMS
jgi:hypothetical protein